MTPANMAGKAKLLNLPARDKFAGSLRLEDSRGRVPVPVLRPRLPLAEALLPYLQRIDQNQCYSNYGPLVRELEQRLAGRLGLLPGNIASASSGTAALVGAILASAGRATASRNLALLPAYTFVGTAVAAQQCGYAPFLADIDPTTWSLDPERLLHLPELPQVGLVMPVAPYGRPVPQAPWRKFQETTGIKVVIDGAASFEGVCADRETFLGPVPVALSFHATKSFSTGEGGAVVCTDENLTHSAMQSLNFGFSGDRNSRVASINGKMSEYHAAVGLAELDGWETKRAGLNAVIAHYRRRLQPTGLGERFFSAPEVGACYGLFLCENTAEAARVQESLRRHDVDFRLWYGKGLHHQNYYADLPREKLEVTDHIAPCLLGIPVGRNLDESMIERVVAGLADASKVSKAFFF